MGYNRPASCEDCGKVDLSWKEAFVVRVIEDFYEAVVNTDPLTGRKALNVEALRSIVKDQVDSFFDFVRIANWFVSEHSKVFQKDFHDKSEKQKNFISVPSAKKVRLKRKK